MKTDIVFLLLGLSIIRKGDCETCYYRDVDGTVTRRNCDENYSCCHDNTQCCYNFWTRAVVTGFAVGAFAIVGVTVTVIAYCIFNVCCKSASAVGHHGIPPQVQQVSYIETTQPVPLHPLSNSASYAQPHPQNQHVLPSAPSASNKMTANYDGTQLQL